MGGAISLITIGAAIAALESTVIAIPESIISNIDIPFGTLAVDAFIATVAGVLAAPFPARRAARLDVLDAIAAS